MNILVIDNYDSFTYNLVQYIERIEGMKVAVARNDKVLLEDIDVFDKIVISPGPGIPDEAGVTKQVIASYGSKKSILGVCLGHQAIAEVYGGKISNLDTVYHGVPDQMRQVVHDEYIFKGVPEVFEAGRYHSWIVIEDGFPGSLEITARNAKGDIMAVRHRDYDVHGVQFHPESVLTEFGGMIVKNWLDGKLS